MASGVKVSKLNFELNPRGNLWFNDDTTFGHKLLTKMGWNKGKGLGKNEDGIKENIKISKKESNTGVGWQKDAVPIAVGCLEYENILQNLQKRFNTNQVEVNADEKFEKSLEQRSRSARNHLHYHKFVRGKDLIRYSEKDMKSIFLEKPQKPVSSHPSHLPQTPIFNSQISVNDYFAMKMQKKKEDASKSESNVMTEANLPSQQNVSKKRKFVSESPETDAPRKTKLKKKNIESEISNSSAMESVVTDKSPETEETTFVFESPETDAPRKTKLKKKKIESEIPSSSATESLLTDKSAESEETTKRKKKKSKKNKSRLQQLKSCLKNKAAYDFEKTRNVSFNEWVSYKILEPELCEDGEEPDVEPDEEVSFDRGSEGEKVSINDEGEEEKEEAPQCFDLPKSSGSNFNFWLESQRQASKMNLYKEMMKKIKKNKILRSTNLLDIKGYGNWGL